MIKTTILLIGAVMTCYGRPQDEGTLHVVYSKMLSEVGPSQQEPRSGVAYVYSIAATELPLVTEYASLKSSEISVPQEIDTIAVQKTENFPKKISAAPKLLSIKDNVLVSKQQAKEKIVPYLSIDPLDPKANESGTNEN